MINHISIGIRDIVLTRRFYDAVLEPLGYTCKTSGDGYLGYGKESVQLWLLKSESPVRADPNSGLHLCFDAPSRTSVDAFHRVAMNHGAKDNGAAGLRPDYGANYYAAFVVDPDGYRIEAYCSQSE